MIERDPSNWSRSRAQVTPPGTMYVEWGHWPPNVMTMPRIRFECSTVCLATSPLNGGSNALRIWP